MTDPEGLPETTGPPDRQILHLFERHLDDDPLVAKTIFEPNPQEPRTLRAVLDSDRYPAHIDEARLDIRWFESGDFSVHYIEAQNGDHQWECRWDRHPNDHNDRLHFHQPPDGAAVEDLSVTMDHPLGVYSTVLTAIERRVEESWTEEDN